MKNLRVLIVEDESVIAMLLEQYVEGAGCEVASVASHVKQAMDAVMQSNFDVALLDINLHGQRAHALPAMLTARGKPFAFLTGYGDDGVLGAYASAPLLRKPYSQAEVTQLLRNLVGTALDGRASIL